MWETPEDIALFAEDDKAEFDDPTACTSALVDFLPGDDVFEWSEGNRVAKKLVKLRRLRAEAVSMSLTPALFSITRAITNLQRGRLKKNSKESRQNAVFSRLLRAEAATAKTLQLKNGAKARKDRETKRRKALVAARIKRTKLC